MIFITFTKLFKSLSQPLGGERLSLLLRQVIQVEISYCAASHILLIIPKTIPVCINCNKINLRLKGYNGYRYFLFSESEWFTGGTPNDIISPGGSDGGEISLLNKGAYISYFTGRP